MPYYIGDVIRKAEDLIARTPGQFAGSNIDVFTGKAVESIDTEGGRVKTSDGAAVPYDNLVIATGNRAIRPDIPGAYLPGVFVMKDLSDAIAIKRWLVEKGCRRAVIVGAGFIGVELSEGFRRRGLETTMLHRGRLPVARFDDELSRAVRDELVKNGVSFVERASVTAVEGGSGDELRVVTEDREYAADIVVFGVGVKPETTLAREAGIAIGPSGAVKVNFSQRTNREEIYAVGDCAEAYHRVRKDWVNIPLGDIANKQGRVAGANLGGSPRTFPGIVGGQSFKVFGLEAAATGIEEREALTCGYSPATHLMWGTFRTPTLEGEANMGIKLVADRSTGRLLGAQGISNVGAVSRINTLSVCLWTAMTLDEIGYLDLAYSPPYGGAWDIIHRAAQRLLRDL